MNDELYEDTTHLQLVVNTSNISLIIILSLFLGPPSFDRWDVMCSIEHLRFLYQS